VPHYQLATAWCNAPSVEAYDAFVCGYGLARTTLDAMGEDMTALIVLELLSAVRWAQDHRPQDLLEQSQNTRRLVSHLYADRLQ
jgi:hypothetical protein